jgi:steroid 5-alpha reductase family enzyme
MDTGSLATLFHESLYLIVVFSGFFAIALMKGRYAIVNIIFALYLALLISLKFPYFDFFLSAGSPESNAVVMIIIFSIFTILGIILFRRHIPGDDYESAFRHFWTKLLLALLATALVMAYSYQALPVTELITPGSPIQSLFGPEENFFWWLILPLIALFFVI